MKKAFWIVVSLVILGTLMVSACGQGGGTVAVKGNRVKVDYTGKLGDGTVFDSSKGKQPLEFTLGDGNMIQGFDKAVYGMKKGETKTVTIPASEAYGTSNPDLIKEINKSELPAGMDPAVGQKLTMRTDGGNVNVRVIKVSGTTITIDANHELAGKDLTFEITLVEIEK